MVIKHRRVQAQRWRCELLKDDAPEVGQIVAPPHELNYPATSVVLKFLALLDASDGVKVTTRLRPLSSVYITDLPKPQVRSRSDDACQVEVVLEK